MRNAKTEAQLASMAHASERANRPTIVVVIAAVLTIGSAVYAGVSYFSMQTQGRRLQDTIAAAEHTSKTLADIKALKDAEVDLSQVFPDNKLLGSQIRDYATAALEDGGLDTDSIVVKADPPRRLLPSTPVQRRPVRITLLRRPLPVLLDFVTRVVNDPEGTIDHHENLYIATLKLNPDAASDTWMLDVQFEMLVYLD